MLQVNYDILFSKFFILLSGLDSQVTNKIVKLVTRDKIPSQIHGSLLKNLGETLLMHGKYKSY